MALSPELRCSPFHFDPGHL